MSTMITLPCPFCGERERLHVVTTGTSQQAVTYLVVRCQQCRAQGPKDPDPVEAWAAWNRRNVTGAVHPLPSVQDKEQ